MPLTTDMSVDTRIVRDHLAKAAPGELVTYDRLSGLVGRDVQNEARHLLESARRMLLRDRGIAFGCETGEGLRRLDDAGKVRVFDDALGRIRRKARNTARVVSAVEKFDALTPDQKTRHNLALSVLGAVSAVTDGRKVKRLETKIAQRNAMLAATESLKLFAGDGEGD